MAATLGLLVLCILAPTVSATDYSGAEAAAEKILLDPTMNLGIESADVSFNDQQVTINCITQISVQKTSAPLESIGRFLGGVLAVYITSVNAAPELGDLLIIMKNRNEHNAATFSCPKSWVTGDFELMNEDDNLELMTKVFMTFKEV